MEDILVEPVYLPQNVPAWPAPFRPPPGKKSMLGDFIQELPVELRELYLVDRIALPDINLYKLPIAVFDAALSPIIDELVYELSGDSPDRVQALLQRYNKGTLFRIQDSALAVSRDDCDPDPSDDTYQVGPSRLMDTLTEPTYLPGQAPRPTYDASPGNWSIIGDAILDFAPQVRSLFEVKHKPIILPPLRLTGTSLPVAPTAISGAGTRLLDALRSKSPLRHDALLAKYGKRTLGAILFNFFQHSFKPVAHPSLLRGPSASELANGILRAVDLLNGDFVQSPEMHVLSSEGLEKYQERRLKRIAQRHRYQEATREQQKARKSERDKSRHPDGDNVADTSAFATPRSRYQGQFEGSVD